MGGRRGVLTCFIVTAGICLAADLLSKHYVFEWIRRDGRVVLVDDYLQFDAKLNQGGMWSIGHGFGWRTNTLLATFSGVVATAILFWALTSLRRGEAAFAVVLGAIMGGALGNLHDRIRFDGVRDFIEVHYRDVYYYPTFNVADSCLVCGAIYMVLASLFVKPRADVHQAPTPCDGSPVAAPADSANL